jgi:hypothetical protein
MASGVTFAQPAVDLRVVGLFIALGLVLVFVAAVLVRTSLNALLLAALLSGGAAGVWIVWAENQYRNLTSCPWDAQANGHPVRVGLPLPSHPLSA